MGDRTYQQVTIWQCPEDLARAVAETSEDLKYEYLGDHYVVLGGTITGVPCDSDGEDLVYVRELEQILADDGLTADERLARIEQVAQVARRAALREARGTGEQRTILLPAEEA